VVAERDRPDTGGYGWMRGDRARSGAMIALVRFAGGCESRREGAARLVGGRDGPRTAAAEANEFGMAQVAAWGTSPGTRWCWA
jgi:hypothetical protein